MPRFTGANRRRRRWRAAKKIQDRFRKYRRRRGRLQKQITVLRRKVYKITEHRWQDKYNYSDSFGAGGLIKKVGLELIALQPSSANLQDNRLGNKITLQSIYLKGQIAVGDVRNFCRIGLVRVLNLAQAVNIDDILQPQFGSVLPTIYSPYRKDSPIKFKILHDKFYKTQQQAAGSTYPSVVNFDLSYKWKKGLTVTYLQDTASDPIYNSIFLFAISDSTGIPHPSFRSFKRLSWIA